VPKKKCPNLDECIEPIYIVEQNRQPYNKEKNNESDEDPGSGYKKQKNAYWQNTSGY
jgi:hypothetical protein